MASLPLKICALPKLVALQAVRSNHLFLNLDQLLVLDRRLHLLRQLRRNIVYAMGRLGMFGSLLHHFILGRATRNEVAALH